MSQSRVWFLFFIGLTLALAFTTETSGFEHSYLDFSVYLEAAKNVGRGLNPYATPYLPPAEAGSMGPLYYLYPPLTSVVLYFVQPLGREIIEKIWVILSFCSLSGAIYFLWRSFADDKEFSHWQIVSLLALVVFPPTMDGIGLGQVDAFIFFLLALIAWAITKNKQEVAGVAIAIAASIKVSPILLALLLFRFRYTNGKKAFFIAMILIGLLPVLTPRGFALNFDYLDTLSSLSHGQSAWTTANNYSVAHFLVSLLPFISISKASTIGEIAALFLLAYLFFFRASNRVQNRLILFSAIICVMLLFSPYISFHHLIWVIVPACGVIYVDPKSNITARFSWFLLIVVGLSLLIDRYLEQNGTQLETLDLVRPGLVVLPILCFYSMLVGKLKTLN